MSLIALGWLALGPAVLVVILPMYVAKRQPPAPFQWPRRVADLGFGRMAISVKALVVLCEVIACASAQSDLRNTITVSPGWAQNVGRTCCPGTPTVAGNTAPVIGVAYAYRVLPNLDLEAGVATAFSVGTEASGANFDFKAHDSFIWAPFGLRGVLPLRRDRVELSAAADGLYEKYHVGNSHNGFFGSRAGWGGHASVRAAVGLDRRRHFWIGASPHLYLVNSTGLSRDRWFVLNLDFAFRF